MPTGKHVSPYLLLPKFHIFGRTDKVHYGSFPLFSEVADKSSCWKEVCGQELDHLRMQLICFCDSPSCCEPSSLANLGGDFEHPARILYLFHDFLYAKSIGLLIILNDNANWWGSAVGSRVEGFSYSLLFFVLFTTSLFINIMLNINETF